MIAKRFLNDRKYAILLLGGFLFGCVIPLVSDLVRKYAVAGSSLAGGANSWGVVLELFSKTGVLLTVGVLCFALLRFPLKEIAFILIPYYAYRVVFAVIFLSPYAAMDFSAFSAAEMTVRIARLWADIGTEVVRFAEPFLWILVIFLFKKAPIGEKSSIFFLNAFFVLFYYALPYTLDVVTALTVADGHFTSIAWSALAEGILVIGLSYGMLYLLYSGLNKYYNRSFEEQEKGRLDFKKR